MGFKTIYTQVKNLARLPTSLYTYTASIQDDNELRQSIIADYWFGRILCSVMLGMLYYLLSELYTLAGSYIPPIFDRYTGTFNQWSIPAVFFAFYLFWKVFLEMEFSHATHLAKIPNQLPRFFLLGHSYTKLRQLFRCNFRKFYGSYELEMNLNADSSLPNGRGRDSGLSNSVVKSKNGISCYWENAWKPVVTVSSPDKIQTLMMLKPEHHFEARYYCPFKKLSFLQGSGIMSQDGDFWKATREQLEKPFNAFVYNEDIKAKYLTCVKDEISRNIIGPLNKCTKQTLSSGEVDVDTLINHMVFNVIWSFIFDIDFGSSGNDSTTHTMIRNAFIASVGNATYFNYNNEQQYASKSLSMEFKTLFNDYVKNYETSNKNRDSSNGNLKMMSVANIALVGEATFSHWKRKETIDNLMTILVMGYQSTNIALKWVVYDLAQNTHHQQKIRHGDKGGNHASGSTNVSAAFNGTELLLACIKESMRLHPPVPYLCRYLLKEVKAGKYTIPAKTMVRISIYDIHRSLEIYGRDADKTKVYDPVGNFGSRNSNRIPFSFIPYGAGGRNCIGLHVSQFIIETTVRELIRNFDFKTNVERIFHKFDGYFCNLESDLKLHFKRA